MVMATSEKKQMTETGAVPREAGKDSAPRLTWATKPETVERVALPFQVVETINASRATREAERGSLFSATGDGNTEAPAGWRNKLVWGDNKLVMASLLKEFAGEANLIYIDPPFDTGTDFSFQVRIGDERWTKEPSIIEEHAYSDTWGAGISSYLSMMYSRLALIEGLLAPNGTFYLHVGRNVSHYLKLVCDEIFGRHGYVNEITWKRAHAHGDTGQGARHFGRVTESILVYRKGDEGTWHPQYVPYTDEILARDYKYVDEESGRRYRLMPVDGPGGAAKGNPYYEFLGVSGYWRFSKDRMQELYDVGEIVLSSTGKSLSRKRFLDEAKGTPITDLWDDVNRISPTSRERLGYATQKPEALLNRIIETSSEPEDLVMDVFCGSGTTLAVAETLGRRWVGCDLGRFAIHTTRKRLLDLPGCKPFEILNLGLYERQHWQKSVAGDEIDAYLNFVLALYDAQPVEGYRLLHGKKAGRLVHVGSVDAPVTSDDVEQVLDELAANDLGEVDVLGWEWEMGLHDVVTEQARRRGIDLACRQIPREVMKAELGDEIRFFELAYLALEIDRDARSVRVQLRDFVIPSDELIPESVRSEITQWSDYIDYWSVDFNFRDDTFHNEWQTYRTREEPNLATESDWHDYEKPGRYATVVKVIDIFGNDTTKLAEVVVK